MKYSCILAFGDSFMSGTELDGRWAEYKNLLAKDKISIYQMDEATKPLAFPSLVGKMLDIPCYNFAMSGGSNERSLRYLLNNLNHYTNPLVLFGYTSHLRKEFFYPLNNNNLLKDETSFVQVGSIANAWHGDENGKSVREKNFISDMFFKHFMHEYDNTTEIASCVESFCRYYSIDVIHIPLLKFKEISKLSDKFPSMKIYDFDGKKCFQAWYTAKGFKLHDYGHPVKEAHIELANNLVKYINDNKTSNVVV